MRWSDDIKKYGSMEKAERARSGRMIADEEEEEEKENELEKDTLL